jgi:hypothetical protein
MKYNFIIPYRNRKEHLDEFIRRFTEMLKDKDIDAQFYIIHQMNPKDFNRGALNNIGFLEVCKIRPDGLFIFHDVDAYPTYWGSIKYDTNFGEFRRPVLNSGNDNLGLICCCWKPEFEKTNGFANYWGWGSEDTALYYRAKRAGININQQNIINHTDSKYIINRDHYRNAKKENTFGEINGNLMVKERESGDNSNGITNIKYEVLSSFELAPRFTIINVDFILKSES